jgi:hypothetical protein
MSWRKFAQSGHPDAKPARKSSTFDGWTSRLMAKRPTSKIHLRKGIQGLVALRPYGDVTSMLKGSRCGSAVKW